jgi:hypothetical protein
MAWTPCTEHFWDPEVEWHDVAEFPDAAVNRGRDAARQALQRYIDMGGDFEIHPDEFRDAGDEVFAAWRYLCVTARDISGPSLLTPLTPGFALA